MKKGILLALAALCLLSGCAQPDSLTLDLHQGYGEHVKLLHLNASTAAKQERIEGFYAMLEDAEPLEKEFRLFSYYPDYYLRLQQDGHGTVAAVVDVNGDYVDFYYMGEDVAKEPQLYRSHMTAEEFRALVHQN